MKKIAIILLAVLVLAGCGRKAVEQGKGTAEVTDETNAAADKESASEAKASGKKAECFLFKYNDVTIKMNSDAASVIKALGEPQDYFEAESCAFKGLDKIYYYSGIELSTYPKDDKDYISSVNLVDDSVSTSQGISLGSKLSEVKIAYGKEYQEDSGAYTYTLGDSKLTFVIEDDAVAAITYLAVVEELK